MAVPEGAQRPSDAEEITRSERFPGVAFRGEDARRRAWVMGTGLDVWEIVHMLEDVGSPEALVADTQLSLEQVHLALDYRDAHPEEIGEAIAANRRPIADVRIWFPFVIPADR